MTRTIPASPGSSPPGRAGGAPLLEVVDLHTEFATRRGVVRAVDGASLTVRHGEAVGLVGESGCGKSALALSIMGLIEPPGRVSAGRVLFEGEDLLARPAAEMRRLRGQALSMIFQDPTATLNPVLPVGRQIAEVVRHHRGASAREARARAMEMLRLVGIPSPEQRYGRYPHEFSGGMQQRVIIACALVLGPRLVIADEPTTALDVTIQSQILDLLRDLQAGAAGTAVVLISHDLGVVAEMCERVYVMYAGNVVETGPTAEILERPQHPYTAGLLASIPRLDVEDQALAPIPGAVADPLRPPAGCKFHPRCPHAFDRCR
ncbi:MAG: ABC transporter ATP-binding protein, partial [Candidatus Rokuibacteriota bacterium]